MTLDDMACSFVRMLISHVPRMHVQRSNINANVKIEVSRKPEQRLFAPLVASKRLELMLANIKSPRATDGTAAHQKYMAIHEKDGRVRHGQYFVLPSIESRVSDQRMLPQP